MPAEDVLYRFPGLFSFEDNDLSSQLFSGREEDGHKLLQYILAEMLTILHGTSGNGKTSILQAYVFRKLREYLYYPVMIRLNVRDESPQEIIKARFREIEKQTDFDFIEQHPKDGSVKSFLNATGIWQGIRLLTPVIVFDQFEEIFTLEHNNPYREEFFEELATIVNACREGKLNCKVVISMRGDMLNRLDNIAHLIPSILANRYPLKPLSRAGAEKAIVEPAEKKLVHANGTIITLPFHFTEDAKEDLLNFLCLKKVSGAWKQSDEVAPIQLQIICRELEEKAVAKAEELTSGEAVEITCKDLKGEDKTVAAGLQHILGGFYNKQITKLKTELNLTESEILSIRNVIETDLIAGTRRVPIDYFALIAWPNVRQEGIDLLIKNRLLKSEEKGDNTLVEISHDTLIEPILESYELRKLGEANNLYEKLMHKARDLFDLSSEEQKALQTLIEHRLIIDDKRAALDYSSVIAQPNIRKEAIKYLIGEKLLAINQTNTIEISHDIYVNPILKQAELRKAEEEKTAKEIELAVEKEKIKSNKKIVWAVVTLLSVAVICAAFYIANLNAKNSIIEQMAMLFKGNEYLEKGDLVKAFGIYGNLYEKNNKTIRKQLDSLKLDYTDIPGSSVRMLANNHILSELNDTTYQIWRVISANNILIDTTFTNIKLIAYSPDYACFAVYANNQLILYNSHKDGAEDTVLLHNKLGDKEPYFSFSNYTNYFSYYQNNTVYTINLNNRNEFRYKWDEDFRPLLKNVLYVSGSVLYAYYDDNIYGWINNGKDSFELDENRGLIMHGTPWVSVNESMIMYDMSKGLTLFNLLDSKITIVEKGKSFQNDFIERPSANMVFLYSSKYFSNEKRYKDYNLTFYNLTKGLLNHPFDGDTIEHLSVNVDYTKCLIGDKNHQVYLVDNNSAGKTELLFLRDAIAYDISDDGNNVLFVKENRKQVTDAANMSNGGKKEKKVSYLYLYSLADTSTLKLPQLIDTTYMNPNAEDSTSIYAKYYFRFSSDSKLFAYTQERNDSTFFVVRNLSDHKVIFSSSKIEKSIDDGNKKDFLSYYVHVQSKDGKEGVILLNGKPRNVAYFSKLYPTMTPGKYEKEVKNLHLNL